MGGLTQPTALGKTVFSTGANDALAVFDVYEDVVALASGGDVSELTDIPMQSLNDKLTQAATKTDVIHLKKEIKSVLPTATATAKDIGDIVKINKGVVCGQRSSIALIAGQEIEDNKSTKSVDMNNAVAPKCKQDMSVPAKTAPTLAELSKATGIPIAVLTNMGPDFLAKLGANYNSTGTKNKLFKLDPNVDYVSKDKECAMMATGISMPDIDWSMPFDFTMSGLSFPKFDMPDFGFGSAKDTICNALSGMNEYFKGVNIPSEWYDFDMDLSLNLSFLDNVFDFGMPDMLGPIINNAKCMASTLGDSTVLNGVRDAIGNKLPDLLKGGDLSMISNALDAVGIDGIPSLDPKVLMDNFNPAGLMDKVSKCVAVDKLLDVGNKIKPGFGETLRAGISVVDITPYTGMVASQTSALMSNLKTKELGLLVSSGDLFNKPPSVTDVVNPNSNISKRYGAVLGKLSNSGGVKGLSEKLKKYI